MSAPAVVAATRPASSPLLEWLARSRAWISISLLIPAGILAAGSPSWIEADSPFDLACQSLGWLAFVAGAVIRWWATLHIGGRKTQELVTEGPYSLCRNPLYLGTFLMLAAVILFIESLTLAGAVSLVAIYYLGVTVTVEERRLEGIYGQQFRDYVTRVPRFLPFGKLSSPKTLTVEFGGLKAEAIRMLRWMWIPVLCQLFNVARQQQWWETFANWP